MKRKLLFTFIALSSVAAIYAQHFTLRVQGGYAGPGFLKNETVKGPVIDAFHPERDGLIFMANRNFFKDSSTQTVYGSYGQGMNFALGFGYMFNPYIGIDMGLSYLRSDKIKSQERHEIVLNTFGGFYAYTGHYFDVNISTNAQSLSLMPSLVVRGAKPGWKVYPYGRFGISLPVFGTLTHNINIDLEEGLESDTNLLKTLVKEPFFLGQKTEVKLETEGTVSIGFNGAVGVAYQPLPYMNVFLELNGQYLVTRAKETRITQWDADGESKLEERGKYRTEFVYTDELNKSSNNADYNPDYDKTKPKDDFRPTGPFNNLGFNVGVTFFLSKETLKKKSKEASK